MNECGTEIYSQLNEPQLAHIFEPEPGLFIAETPMIVERALAAGYEPVSMLIEEGHEAETEQLLMQAGFTCRSISLPLTDTVKTECGKAKAGQNTKTGKQVEVYVASGTDLTAIAGFKLTRGIMCAMRRKKLPTVPEACLGATRIAVLEEVMNPTNVGAIFRSAAALNMDAVLLTGGCSDPLYRRAARVSMGTCFAIPWTYIDEKESDYVDMLKGVGYKTVAMALRENSCAVNDKGLRSEEKLAVILGTEGEGLKDRTISSCDYTVMIPMSHGVDSLNVAAAGAVVFWELGHNK